MENTLSFAPDEIGRIDKDWLDVHANPNEEIKFYRCVAGGAIAMVQENCARGDFEHQDNMGLLSDDPVTNMKYHFVVTASLICRFCVEGGMPLEESFRLCDSYIRRMDRLNSIADIVLLHDRMALDYVGRMRQRKKQAAASKQVADAIDYIYEHILERITVDDISAAVNISPAYLSRIFKNELGVSVSEYIRQRRIEIAKNMLRFSDRPLSDIAAALAYSSQSHFIQHFKSQVGMTPKAFRAKYYGDNFDVKHGNASDDEN